MAFLKSLSTWSTFGKGWARRVDGVRAYSKVLATRNNVACPIAGTVIAGTGITFSQYIHAHQNAVLIGASVLALVVGILIHLYANKGK